MTTMLHNNKADDFTRAPIKVRSIVCPVHGDVTEEVGDIKERWPLYATIELLRSGAVHHYLDCTEQLLWELDAE